MNTDAVQVCVVVLVLLAILLWKVPGPCICGKCSFHVNERRVQHEEWRVKEHRARHSAFRLKWGDEVCGECRAGHADDEPVDSTRRPQ